MTLTRHDIRKAAFQTLFAVKSNADADPKQVMLQVLDAEEQTDSALPEYLVTLVEGVIKHEDELNDAISNYLKKGWTVKRLNKTDLLILQIAVFEIKYVTDIPAKVSINEALQLAKEFSDDKSRGFINGVLANLI